MSVHFRVLAGAGKGIVLRQRTGVDEYDSVGWASGIGYDEGTAPLPHVQPSVDLVRVGVALGSKEGSV